MILIISLSKEVIRNHHTFGVYSLTPMEYSTWIKRNTACNFPGLSFHHFYKLIMFSHEQASKQYFQHSSFSSMISEWSMTSYYVTTGKISPTNRFILGFLVSNLLRGSKLKFSWQKVTLRRILSEIMSDCRL